MPLRFARPSVVLVIFALCLPSARADWRALTDLQQSGARVSATAVDLEDGSVIQQLNADVRLTPASLTKLAVAATALSIWPADKMFKTQLLAAGTLSGAQLTGDLYLVGAGDPSLTGANLLSLAAQLRAIGVTSVSGKLIVTPWPFATVECETKDRCDARTRSDTAYDAPLASIGTDFGTWCVDVRGTKPGAPATIAGCTSRLPIPVQGTIQTTASAKDTPLRVERFTSDGNDVLRVGGTIQDGDAQDVYRAMSDPARGAGLLLNASLEDLGVTVAGGTAVRDGSPPPTAFLVGRTEGLALKEQLGRMLRFSNNYIADVLTLTMAADLDNAPPKSLSDAAKTLSSFMLRTQNKQKAAPRVSAPPLFSGSGLTPENELSANDLVRLLSYEYRDTRNFGPFYGGLVVPRQSPFVFLRNGSPAWQDRVALKTGTMDDPHSVCGMAGYIRKKDGGWLTFAVIVNGGVTQNRHVPLYKALEAIRTDLEQLLARY
ncbi:MAG TPA: D-alanyl-D-alanine carboxypeptidase/D-alanyl-D-alanine-endopeptidase [Pseudomonadales bacterium]|nr:D-alanyl-D-alanine carboxypeptidase/D-alanyl-D-alanine-endopeptidase [Pseudomonadales bacterium]